MPKRSNAGRRRPAYWWNEKIAGKRKIRIQRKRSFHRTGTSDDSREQERTVLQQAKKELKIAIRSNQDRAWKELLYDVEADVWGLSYKIVAKNRTDALRALLRRARK